MNRVFKNKKMELKQHDFNQLNIRRENSTTALVKTFVIF